MAWTLSNACIGALAPVATKMPSTRPSASAMADDAAVRSEMVMATPPADLGPPARTCTATIGQARDGWRTARCDGDGWHDPRSRQVRFVVWANTPAVPGRLPAEPGGGGVLPDVK